MDAGLRKSAQINMQYLSCFVILALLAVPAYASSWKALTCEAIEKKYHLEIIYHYDYSIICGHRVVEPYYLGEGRNGHLYIHAYQISGCSRSGGLPNWRNFRLDKIKNLTLSKKRISSYESKRSLVRQAPYIKRILCIN